MTDRVTVNRDRTALLSPHSPEKGWQITRKEAAELGLLDSADKPVQERRSEPQQRRIAEPTAPKRKYTKRK